MQLGMRLWWHEIICNLPPPLPLFKLFNTHHAGFHTLAESLLRDYWLMCLRPDSACIRSITACRWVGTARWAHGTRGTCEAQAGERHSHRTSRCAHSPRLPPLEDCSSKPHKFHPHFLQHYPSLALGASMTCAGSRQSLSEFSSAPDTSWQPSKSQSRSNWSPWHRRWQRKPWRTCPGTGTAWPVGSWSAWSESIWCLPLVAVRASPGRLPGISHQCPSGWSPPPASLPSPGSHGTPAHHTRLQHHTVLGSVGKQRQGNKSRNKHWNKTRFGKPQQAEPVCAQEASACNPPPTPAHPIPCSCGKAKQSAEHILRWLLKPSVAVGGVPDRGNNIAQQPWQDHGWSAENG